MSLFLFLLVSGVGCDFCLWLFLNFSIYLFLDDYLTKWMELGKAEKTFEGLKDHILREEFLSVSNRSLLMFLKERKLNSV